MKAAWKRWRTRTMCPHCGALHGPTLSECFPVGVGLLLVFAVPAMWVFGFHLVFVWKVFG